MGQVHYHAPSTCFLCNKLTGLHLKFDISGVEKGPKAFPRSIFVLIDLPIHCNVESQTPYSYTQLILRPIQFNKYHP